MQLAIDAGHGYVKGLSSRGGQILFPALIHPAPTRVDLGSFGQTAITMIDEVPYLVGEPARRVATPLWSHDKAVDDDTLRLILVAAAELGASGPVRLATGLPLSWFGAQHRTFKQTLKDYGGMVKTTDGRQTRLWFDTVLVLPQGVAAAGPILDQASYEPGPYLVVDIGYRTTDFIIVTKHRDGGLDFDPMAAGSLNIGMYTADAGLAESLSAQHRTAFTAA